MKVILMYISVCFSLINCVSNREIISYGEYTLKSNTMRGDLILRNDGTFDYMLSSGLFNQNSAGMWKMDENSIILNSYYQIDSAIVNQKNVSEQSGLVVKSTDLSDIVYSTKVIIDDEKFFDNINGTLIVDEMEWSKISVLFFNYSKQVVDTVLVRNISNSNFILVKHINTLNYSNYRFFDNETVKVGKNELIISDSKMNTLVFSKPLFQHQFQQ